MSAAGLILFAHGSRDPRWAEPFETIRDAVSARAPALPVRLAYLELMQPDLAAAADALVAEGCTRIDVLPLFLGTGGHLRRDLPPMVEAIRARHPQVIATLHAAAGEAPALIAAMADHALSLATR
ncbi:MAG TPA: CbiX/SirB N-terminal domain-containing protein [Burkholderiaceae bacterium]|jgi:sirohydrochlorin cobaltochelatase|nr:CbiX/SirB N-terminal domain-containing protein [Burkholderiaceae bacterium]